MNLYLYCLLALVASLSYARTIRELKTDAVHKIELQRILIVAPKLKQAVRRTLIKQKIPVVAEGKAFLVVRRGKATRTAKYLLKLEELSKRKLVKRVMKDRVVIPLAEPNPHSKESPYQREFSKPRPHDFSPSPDRVSIFSESGDCPGESGKNEPLQCKDTVETKEEQEKNCHLAPHCGGENPSWVRLVTGSDLTDEMIEELWKAKNKDPKLLPRVGVVDSGFDQKGNEALLDAQSIRYSKGYENKENEAGELVTSGEANEDDQGHGTAVAGVIAGKGIGITRYAHMSFYRVTDKNSKGVSSLGLLSAAVEKACEENDIVNVSWGSLAAEKGIEPSLLEEVKTRAYEKGCLIIQSAGNSGERGNISRADTSFSAPRLVEAKDTFGSSAFFSSVGNSDAFGQGVYSLVAQSARSNLAKAGDCCNYETGHLMKVQGTSFAAPIMTGMAAQIFAVLKLRGELPDEPRERLMLLNERLDFANYFPNPGGHVSRLSTYWNVPYSTYRTVPSAFAALLRSPHSQNGYIGPEDPLFRKVTSTGDCDAKPLSCLSPSPNCRDRQNCILELRKLYFTCFGQLNFPGAEKTLDLLEMGEHQIFLSLSLLQKDERIRRVLKEDLRKRWEKTLDKTGNVAKDQFPLALQLLNSQSNRYVDSITHDPTFISSKRILQLLRSDYLLGFLDSIPRTSFLGLTPSKIEEEMKTAKLFSILSQIERALHIREGEESVDPQPLEVQDGLLNDASHLSGPKAQMAAFLLSKISWHSKEWDVKIPQFALAVSQGKVRAILPRDIIRMAKFANEWLFSERVGLVYPEYQSQKLWRGDLATLQAPFSSKNLHAISLALVNRNAPTYQDEDFTDSWGMKRAANNKDMLPEERNFVESLLLRPTPSNPDFDMEDYSAILEHSLVLLARESQPRIEQILRKLLTNPYILIPRDLVPGTTRKSTPFQDALIQKNFFPEFIRANVLRGLANLQQHENGERRAPHEVAAGHEMKNILRALSMNASLDSHDLKGFLDTPEGSNLRTLVSNAIQNLSKNEHLKDLKPNSDPALETIRELLKDPSPFIERDLVGELKTMLEPLKSDIEKRKDHYPDEIRILLEKVLCSLNES